MSSTRAMFLDVARSGSMVLLNGIREIDLDLMYGLIGCELVDRIAFPNKIDVWVDDEGLLKSGNRVVEYHVFDDGERTEMKLAGNALFLSRDKDGDISGLSDEQIEWIKFNVDFYLYGEVR